MTILQLIARIRTVIKPSPPRNITATALGDLLVDIANFLQDTVNTVLQYNNFKPIHAWSGTKLRLQNPDGSYGVEVDLKGVTYPLGLILGKNRFRPTNPSFISNKGLSISSNPATVAQIVDAAGFIISDFEPVIPGEQYTFSGFGENKAIQYADGNKVRLSGQWLNTTVPVVITIPANCVYMVYTVKSSTEAVIPVNYQIERGAVATAYEPYSSVIQTIDGNGFKAQQVADNATIQVVDAGNKALMNREAVNAGIVAKLPAYGLNISRNLFNRNATDLQIGKAVTNFNTSGIIVALAPWWVSGYQPVTPGQQYTFSGYGAGKAGQFSDANKVNLGGFQLPQNATLTITIPANCFFICYTVKADTDAEIPANYQVELGTAVTPYVAYFEQIKTVNNIPLVPWFHSAITGKRLTILGDSIATTKPQSGGTQIEWPTFIQTPYWAKVDTAATNGARIKDDPGEPLTSRTVFSYQIQYAIDQGFNPDVIGIFLGTNDFLTVKLGTYEAAMAKTTLASLDRTNFYEALRYGYWKIKTQWPSVVVFHAIPIQRPDRSFEVAKPLNDAIKRMAAVYNVNIIDAEAESGIVNQFEVAGANGRYLRDGLHPNDAGKPMLAAYYMRRMIRVLA